MIREFGGTFQNRQLFSNIFVAYSYIISSGNNDHYSVMKVVVCY